MWDHFWGNFWFEGPILYNILEGWGEFYLPGVIQRDTSSSMESLPNGMANYLRDWADYSNMEPELGSPQITTNSIEATSIGLHLWI